MEKTTQEKIAVMQAYVDGRKIEVSEDGETGVFSKDEYDDEPIWNWEIFDYRIKPNYRPFKDAEECYKECVKHGGWVKNKTRAEYGHILRIETTSVIACGTEINFENLIVFCQWADDGTPCGVLEE